jgi:hypothetical protein
VKWIALAWDANLASRLATFQLIQLDKVHQNCASQNTNCEKKLKIICTVYIGQLNLDYFVAYRLLSQHDAKKWKHKPRGMTFYKSSRMVRLKTLFISLKYLHVLPLNHITYCFADRFKN